MVYEALDVFFLLFHTAIILFNMFGWMWRRTRRYNWYLLMATAVSWGVLGIWYGFGYCPCTDWHWQVLEKLDRYPNTPSYIEYLVERLVGVDISYHTANTATLWIFLLLVSISTYVNWKDYFKNVKNKLNNMLI
ncbi:MAG: hypothetical protein CMC08_02230 [Flavobacteriaceae bacterium]|nr:hypothetical protein [Flavobacteriaceae bacterium]|tara:strand:- start:266 stop:667 length:402 start_codon:yes stop_codon:yes gene_type:complete